MAIHVTLCSAIHILSSAFGRQVQHIIICSPITQSCTSDLHQHLPNALFKDCIALFRNASPSCVTAAKRLSCPALASPALQASGHGAHAIATADDDDDAMQLMLVMMMMTCC